MLINLLSNAVKFSPARTAISLAALALHDGGVALVVRDRGVGIPRDDWARVFEPFVTLDASITREQGGAGLGLALVKRIVELHRGTVTVDSEPGHGTRFVVTLPGVDPAVDAPVVVDDDAPAAAAPAARPRLVLVEDNAQVIATLAPYLEARGYDVDVALDGEAGVARATSGEVDLVLMDVHLPGIDGLTAIGRIRGAPRADRVPIIALTARAMPGDEQACLAAGATAYLSKPVELKTLVHRIEQLIAGARSAG